VIEQRREFARSELSRISAMSVSAVSVSVAACTDLLPRLGRTIPIALLRAFLPVTVLIIAVAPLAGRISDRLGSRSLRAGPRSHQGRTDMQHAAMRGYHRVVRSRATTGNPA
jgi:hypothetical protein